MGQSETKNSRGGVTGKQVRGNYVESSKAIIGMEGVRMESMYL